MIELGENRYGKQEIRLVRVVRDGARHRVRDLTVGVTLEGDFATAHTDADNTLVITTDTMKNTVYAFAREHLTGAIEAFGLALARHFAEFAQVSSATVSIDEHRWSRMPTASGPADDAFVRSGDFTRTAAVTAGGDGAGRSAETVQAGVRDLTVMKTARSGFVGFPRDEYTTLPEVDDRIMATKLTATWGYGAGGSADFDAVAGGVLATLLDVLATHRSESVQHSIWVIGRAVLERHAELDWIRMVLPNLHHWLVDLAPFGQPNANEVFVATVAPHGLIDATVRRGS